MNKHRGTGFCSTARPVQGSPGSAEEKKFLVFPTFMTGQDWSRDDRIGHWKLRVPGGAVTKL